MDMWWFVILFGVETERVARFSMNGRHIGIFSILLEARKRRSLVTDKELTRDLFVWFFIF
jgi:hypothetical protein